MCQTPSGPIGNVGIFTIYKTDCEFYSVDVCEHDLVARNYCHVLISTDGYVTIGASFKIHWDELENALVVKNVFQFLSN